MPDLGLLGLGMRPDGDNAVSLAGLCVRGGSRCRAKSRCRHRAETGPVHQHGVGECGVYTYEVAETKVTQVMDFSRKHQHPLQCVMEKK